MQREIIVTNDNSHTISVASLGVAYHSRYGAITESQHVFIREGLETFLAAQPTESVRILEMGFGTGLNALLTLMTAEERPCHINYHGIENDPLLRGEVQQLNYPEQLNHPEAGNWFRMIHELAWDSTVNLTDFFRLEKHRCDMQSFATNERFEIIYYDAFAPNAQPELWTENIFAKLYQLMVPGGLLVTYCAKGAVRRAMQSAGLTVERPAGPPGKREMLRAKK